MQSTFASWSSGDPTVLDAVNDLDTAVAVGASYYGWCKSNGGIRIRGGTAKSYYIGIETAGPAIPGVPRPLRAVCVAPHGMEEGTEMTVPGTQVGVVVGKPFRYRFFASSVRVDDAVGEALSRWSDDEVSEIEPITVTLDSDSADANTFVPVQFVSRITELGMFELWCHSTQSDDAWKMEFNARED